MSWLGGRESQPRLREKSPKHALILHNVLSISICRLASVSAVFVCSLLVSDFGRAMSLAVPASCAGLPRFCRQGTGSSPFVNPTASCGTDLLAVARRGYTHGSRSLTPGGGPAQSLC